MCYQSYLAEDFPPGYSPVVINENILASPCPALVWAAISVGDTAAPYHARRHSSKGKSHACTYHNPEVHA